MANTQKAVIEGGKVINIIEVDPENVPDWAAGYPDATDARMGDDWDGVTFSRFEADPLILWRERHSIPIKDFCLNLFRAGRLPKQEAIGAGRGIWPATFDAGLAGLTEDQQVAIQLEFAVAVHVRRNHQMIALLQRLEVVVDRVTKPPMTDDEVDTLFGWVAP